MKISPMKQNPYEELMSNMIVVSNADKDLIDRKSYLDGFRLFITDNRFVIKHYKQVSADLSAYFYNFDPDKNYDIDAVHNSISKLIILHKNLQKMHAETTLIDTSRDIHNVHVVVAESEAICASCTDSMGLWDIEAGAKRVEAHLRVVAGVHSAFLSDERELAAIKQCVNSKIDTLSKFKGLNADVDALISKFPIEGFSNLHYVQQIVNSAENINELWEESLEEIKDIKQNRDRYGCANVVSDHAQLDSYIHNTMRYKDVQSAEIRIDRIKDRINEVQDAFLDEKLFIQQLLLNVKSSKKSFWIDDFNTTCMRLKSYLDGNTAKIDIDVKKIESIIHKNKNHKSQTIESTLDKYSWLSKDKYVGTHNALINSDITYEQYVTEIKQIRKARNKKIWKVIGYCVGIPIGIALVAVAIYVFIICLIGYVIFSVMFSSSKDNN